MLTLTTNQSPIRYNCKAEPKNNHSSKSHSSQSIKQPVQQSSVSNISKQNLIHNNNIPFTKQKLQTLPLLSDGQELLMSSLLKFFSDPVHLNKMLPIIKKETRISLRLLDWFVTNYAKNYNTIYFHDGYPFIVYLEYKSQLKAFSKKQFDPFCRTTGKGRTQIPFTYRHGTKEHTIYTTIGQLNFFSWAIKNGIIEYVIEHFENIDKDMNNSSKKLLVSDNKGNNMTISSTKSMSKHTVRVTLQFD